MAEHPLERELEERVEALGYEFVDLERAGSRGRPILRLRIDRPGAAEGQGVSVDDCAKVSRALEEFLDVSGSVPEQYMLEVSSPGVERPLRKARDYARFVGKEVSVKGRESLADRGKRLQGELLGISGDEGAERVRIRLQEGQEVEVGLGEIERANLVFRWGGHTKNG